jgi:hypothetical protein
MTSFLSSWMVKNHLPLQDLKDPRSQLEKKDLTNMTRCFWMISSPTTGHPPTFIGLVVITKIIMQCHYWNMYSLMTSDVHVSLCHPRPSIFPSMHHFVIRSNLQRSLLCFVTIFWITWNIWHLLQRITKTKRPCNF